MSAITRADSGGKDVIEASTKAGFRLKHRTRAMLDDLAERLFKRPDFIKKLETQAVEDPKSFVAWLREQTPADAPAAPTNSLNIGQLFLAAARDVAAVPQLAAPIDADYAELPAGTARVQPASSDW